MRFLGGMMLAALLSACGPAAEQKAEEFPVIEAPNYNADIGPSGAAGISTALAMTVEAISAAAPNYVVTEVQDQVEGQPFTAIVLSAGDEEVFRVLPTADGAHIHSITTRSTQARGPNGEIVGVATFAQAPAGEINICSDESNGSGEFACSTDNTFWRVYESGGMRRADAKLVEMRWIAPHVN